MSLNSIYYGKPDVIAEGSNADVDTTEEDVVEITELDKLVMSQFSVYVDVTLGTHTSMEIRFYYQNETDGSWYPAAKIDTSDGSVDDNPYVFSGSFLSAVIDLPVSAAFGFKATAKGVGGANGSAAVKVLQRDN